MVTRKMLGPDPSEPVKNLNGSAFVNFDTTFNRKPVVTSCVTTENDMNAVAGRISEITGNGFGFGLQEQEKNKNAHAVDETIAYIAWEPSAGTVDGIRYEVGSTFDEVTHNPYQITFNSAFANAPVFVADMQTMNGGDTANIRWQNKSVDGVEVFIDEDESKDRETNHITEVVGYMVFAESNLKTVVFGDTPDADYPGTIEDTFININEDVNVASDQLNTYTWPENMPANAVLIKVDLSQLPPDAQVQSATLQLYQTAAGGDASYDVSVHKIINYDPDFNFVNGYTFDGINSWTPNSECYNGIPLAQADIGPAEDVNSLDLSSGYKEWDVSGMIQGWAYGAYSNCGLMLNSDAMANSNSYRSFAATQALDYSVRPKLTLVYLLPAK